MRKLEWLGSVAAALSLSTPALADGPLSLQSAQAEARAHAPDVAELDARLRGSELGAEAASRVLRSNPSATGTYAPGSLTGHADELSWKVGVSQTFDLSGSWRSRGASAAAERDRSSQERENGLRALDEAVAVTVADLAGAQRRAGRARQIAALQAISAEAAKKQLEIGQGNQLDVDAADLDLFAARADVARTEADVDGARARLARLLGRESSSGLSVEDRPEASVTSAQLLPSAVADGDPRAKAARAELEAARLELTTHERTIWPEVTLGASYAYARHGIPLGSFQGPSAAGLSALWADNEISLALGFPLPLFERKQSERARARGRILLADAQLRKTRADVGQEIESASAGLRGAARAYGELYSTPEIIDREFDLLDKAVRAGALDAVSRALAIRRLQEAGARYDQALLDLRVARARWVRRAAGLP